ncbi:MAG: hypothetical protein IJ233_06870, partial [Pyramidobacter sp.]|nr:hypothetical protein [Pyramidobacter sp.]
KPLKTNWIIHHADYDCECLYPDKVLTIIAATEKRPNRKIKVPDCERCENIVICTKNLYTVCSICNMIIDRIAQKRVAIQRANQGHQLSLFDDQS